MSGASEIKNEDDLARVVSDLRHRYLLECMMFGRLLTDKERKKYTAPLEKKPMSPFTMTPFKMKLMIHCASPANKWPFAATLAPTRTLSGTNSRNATIRRYLDELADAGLIEFASSTTSHGGPVATAKGQAFVDAVMSTPLPVQASPEWVMPGA